MSTADQRHAHYAPPARFPRFQRFLDQGGWHRVAVVDGVAILRPAADGPRVTSADATHVPTVPCPTCNGRPSDGSCSRVVIGGVLLAGCAASESSEIGACPIQPGATCSGNYMKGAQLAGAGLFDADFDHADLTGRRPASAPTSAARR